MTNPLTDQEILQNMIRRMEEGVFPWRRPWSEPTSGVVVGSNRYNAATMWPSNLRAPKVPFGVYNGTILLARASERGYRTNLWIEAAVLEELGAKVVESDDRPVSIARYPDLSKPYGYHQEISRSVFNIDQVQECEKALGLTIWEQDEDLPPIQFESSRELLRLLERDLSLQIVLENHAAYSPMLDVVLMPDISQFHAMARRTDNAAEGETHYWATLWHEVVHWTGHSRRLNRPPHLRWGDEAYAFEELVAELGSAFLCAHLGIDGEMQHESYLDAWCRVLKQDSGVSLREASGLATQAKTFILTKEKPPGSGRRLLRLR